MKYIKKFEKFGHHRADDILYKTKDFEIVINSNDYFTYNSSKISCSGILIMADMIREKSIFLFDQKLRNVRLRTKDIETDVENLNLYNEKYYNKDLKIKNIEKNRTSTINHFLGDFKRTQGYEATDELKIPVSKIKRIPIKAYMELTFKYYPIIASAIKSSETLGDIIDKFTIIYNDLLEDLPLYVRMSEYNI